MALFREGFAKQNPELCNDFALGEADCDRKIAYELPKYNEKESCNRVGRIL